MAKRLLIDSSKGGNGDIWMRLVSFYVFSELVPGYKFSIKIPEFISPLARIAFGDRIEINSGNLDEPDLVYTNLGIKDLYKPILKGKRFISPYQRAVINDKKKKALKDYLNLFIFSVADILGVVQVPPKKYIKCYQGYLDVVAIKKLRKISYEQYCKQLESDYPVIKNRFKGNFPVSPELEIPIDLKSGVLFFPTGTSRQFVPSWWAKEHLKNAYYAFFHKDADAVLFKNAGLKVVYYYKEAGDIIKLSQQAGWTISTDSFSSHLLQSATADCTIALTEVLKSRIVSPSFKGMVADSLAPCHPCLHLARNVQPLCEAGYKECINWKIPGYTNSILDSINHRNNHFE
jgi:hypothetical protein